MTIINTYKMTLDELNRHEFLIVTNALTFLKWGLGTTLAGILLTADIKLGGVLLLIYYTLKLVIELISNQVGYFKLRYSIKTYREQMVLYSFICATFVFYTTWVFLLIDQRQVTFVTLLIALGIMLFQYKAVKKSTHK